MSENSIEGSSVYHILISFLKQKKCKKILLIAHEQPDLDTYASCWGLREILSHLKFDSLIFLPSIPTELNYIVQKMNFPLLNYEREKILSILYESTDLCTILVDFTDLSRLEDKEIKNALKQTKVLIAIDHHRAAQKEGLDFLLFKPYNSTAEIIVEFMLNLNLVNILEKNKKLSTALIGGILVDTSFLDRANSKTFYVLSILSRYSSYSQILHALRNIPKSIDEKIARLKGAQRLKILRVNDTIIAFTSIGSYESSVASSLVKLGADIAIVLSKKKDIARIVGRSKINIDLGEIFKQVANKYMGVGGGHSGAAVLNIKLKNEKELNLVMNDIYRLITQALLERKLISDNKIQKTP